jgi:hypothetical protein
MNVYLYVRFVHWLSWHSNRLVSCIRYYNPGAPQNNNVTVTKKATLAVAVSTKTFSHSIPSNSWAMLHQFDAPGSYTITVAGEHCNGSPDSHDTWFPQTHVLSG